MTDYVPSLIRAGNWKSSGGSGTDGFFHSKISGLGSVSSKREKTSRPNAPGSFPSRGYADDRLVIVKGSCWASTPYKMARYEQTLASLFMDGLGGKVYVDRRGVEVWFWAFRDDAPDFDEVTQKYATYQLPLWVPDPEMFGGQVLPVASGTLGQDVVTWHYGNTDAHPVFKISGSISGGYTINGPNNLGYAVTHPLVSGHPHYVDMATGQLTIDGDPVYGFFGVRSDTWSVPANTKVTQVLNASAGSATLTIPVYDTYIGI